MELELALLRQVFNASGLTLDPKLWRDRAEIKRSRWRIADDLRDLERISHCGEACISLARAIDRSNDRRARLKRLIHQRHGSAIVEAKGEAAS